MSALINLVGKRFGRLYVLRRVENRNNNVYWYCFCSCGERTVVRAADLTFGRTKSCGCLIRDKARSTMTTLWESGAFRERRMRNFIAIAGLRKDSITPKEEQRALRILARESDFDFLERYTKTRKGSSGDDDFLRSVGNTRQMSSENG